MTMQENICSCGAEYGADGICPDCGNIKPEAVKALDASQGNLVPDVLSVHSGHTKNTGLSSRTSKSSRARQLALSLRTQVTARPVTVVAIVDESGKADGKVRKRRHEFSTRTSTRTTRGIAAGLVELETLPPVDAQSLIREGLGISKEQRVCGNPECQHLQAHGEPRNLYREKNGVPIDKGLCPSCRAPFNFSPIPKETVISGQYSVLGPIAVGGFGFIYLAWDMNVGRYVVLKGLLNSRDPEQQILAVQERRFLADLQSPEIVNIVNFVTHSEHHDESQDGQEVDMQTFIVMEFIDGQTLKSIKKKWMQENANAPLPVTDAIYFMLGILPAFTYLHKQGVYYCDFKMENAMLQGDRLRLIDLGGARKASEVGGSCFLTRGYAAPEAGGDNPEPSVSSDLYTVGRTLAVLCTNFDWLEEFEFDLPTPDREPLFARYESFYRFLLRACHRDPDQRFQSALEMSEQLLGVLAEIVSIDTGNARPVFASPEFALDVLREVGENSKPSYLSLTDLKPDRTDSANALIETALAENDLAQQAKLLKQAMEQFPRSAEAPLRLAMVATALKDYSWAETIIAERIVVDPYDFRNIWVKGAWLMAQGRYADAFKHFDAVYSEVPGELAPKLALALCAELNGDTDVALRYYELVSGIDPSFVTAVFGLARCLYTKDAVAAADAFDRVSPLSASFQQALASKMQLLIRGKPNAELLTMAVATMKRINLDGYAYHQLRFQLFEALLAAVEDNRLPVGEVANLVQFAGAGTDYLRLAMEQEARFCAHSCGEQELSIQWIDRANAVRPLTRF